MHYVIPLIMACISFVANAQQMDINESQKVAASFLGKSVINVTDSYISNKPTNVNKSISSTPYRVFCAQDSCGFVILSKENAILGYSQNGFVDGRSMPPQLIDLLNQYESQNISASRTHSSDNIELSQGDVLLNTPNWGQGYPFNIHTPIVPESGEHAETGCVATAMAIILKYHNWPLNTNGKEVVNFYHNDIKVDFGKSAIDWDAFDENAETFNDAVANLMLLTGTSVHTQYDMYGSGASMNGICHELITTFGYSTDCCYIRKKFYSDAEWHLILRNQLNNGLPVIYGSTEENSWSGHTYVIDGMSEDAYHVNWGWDGNFNGFFSLDLLMPNGVNYSDHQSMVINIKPEDSPKFEKISPLHVVYGWNTTFRTGRLNCTTDQIQRNIPLSVTGPVLSFQKFHGYVNFALVDDNDNILEFAKQTVCNLEYNNEGYDMINQIGHEDFDIVDFGGYRLDNDAIYFPLEATSLNEYTCNFVFTDTDIKSNYKLVLLSKEDGESDWKTVLGLDGVNNHLPVQGIRSEYSDVEWAFDETKVNVKYMTPPLMGESNRKVLRYQNDKEYRLFYKNGKANVYINDKLIDNLDFSDDYLGEFYDNIENEPPRLMFTTDLPQYRIKIDYLPNPESGINDVVSDENEEVSVFNLFGDEIYRGLLVNANLSGGIYIVKESSRIYKIVIKP